MPPTLRENLIWLVVVPFGIALIVAIVSVVLTRKWGTPSPFDQKMRHLSKIDREKALLKAFEAIDGDLEAFLFIYLRQFFREFLIGCLLFGVGFLLVGVYLIFFINMGTPTKLITPVATAQIVEGIIQIFGATFLMLATVLAYFSYLAFWHFAVMRRIYRFEKHEKPKVLERLAELERVKD